MTDEKLCTSTYFTQNMSSNEKRLAQVDPQSFFRWQTRTTKERVAGMACHAILMDLMVGHQTLFDYFVILLFSMS